MNPVFNMSEPLKRALHYKQRASECELAKWSPLAQVREHRRPLRDGTCFWLKINLNVRSAPPTGIRSVANKQVVRVFSDEPRYADSERSRAVILFASELACRLFSEPRCRAGVRRRFQDNHRV